MARDPSEDPPEDEDEEISQTKRGRRVILSKLSLPGLYIFIRQTSDVFF